MKTVRMLVILVLALCMVAEIAKADFTFGTPAEVPNVNSSSHEQNASISSEGLSLFFISKRTGGIGGTEIWVTTRETTDDPWGTPVNLGPTINSPVGDGGVSISSDGLSLYFSSTRSSGYGSAGDLWVTMRDTIHNEWDTPMNLGPTVNSSADESYPSISADGLALYFTSNRGGGIGAYDLWVTRRETIHDPWGTPVNLGPTVNSSAQEVDPGISADGRTLFFASNRSGGYGDDDIWVTKRATTDDDWGEPVNLGPIINSSGWEDYPNVSADGSTLFFVSSLSDRWNGGDIWQAPIIPIVDFNGDGIVDSADMCIMFDYGGTDEPLCDIGPMPWGDGIVDVEDLIVLAQHLFENINDPTLIAHWALDETEGMFAADSAGDNDAFIIGSAAWQPGSGQVDGALQLNGVDGCAIVNPVVNPPEGPFSIFAWVKDGSPGQVIISQQSMANWLATDGEGNLMTELKSSDQLAGPLHSETVITDGQWHRIGLVWDGSHRKLYVDGVVVAEDTQSGLEGSQMGLYLGVDKNYAPGTFFSGLIDDVRIYNRAVSP